jgi:hydrogenase expression/formation protein HypC
MCLGVPGKVTEIRVEDGIRMGRIDFGGIVRDACLEYAPDAQVGSFVVVHVGFAIATVNEEEAQRTYALLAQLGNLENIDLDVPRGPAS